MSGTKNKNENASARDAAKSADLNKSGQEQLQRFAENKKEKGEERATYQELEKEAKRIGQQKKYRNSK